MAIRSLPWKTLPLWILIAVGLAALGATVVSELRIRGVSNSPPRIHADGDLVLTGVRFVTTLDGATEWALTAARARVFDRQHQALLDDVRGEAHARDGSVVEFEGPAATFDTMSRDASIDGSDGRSIVRLPDGYTLRAEHLRWNQQTGEASSDDRVSITGPRIAITGSGLILRPVSQELTVLRDVRAHVF
jgi:LPS export ABC transporter protein LptC